MPVHLPPAPQQQPSQQRSVTQRKITLHCGEGFRSLLRGSGARKYTAVEDLAPLLSRRGGQGVAQPFPRSTPILKPCYYRITLRIISFA